MTALIHEQLADYAIQTQQLSACEKEVAAARNAQVAADSANAKSQRDLAFRKKENGNLQAQKTLITIDRDHYKAEDAKQDKQIAKLKGSLKVSNYVAAGGLGVIIVYTVLQFVF